MARPSPLMLSSISLLGTAAKLSLSITFPKLGRRGSPEDPQPVTWLNKKSKRPRLTFTALLLLTPDYPIFWSPWVKYPSWIGPLGG